MKISYCLFSPFVSKPRPWGNVWLMLVNAHILLCQTSAKKIPPPGQKNSRRLILSALVLAAFGSHNTLHSNIYEKKFNRDTTYCYNIQEMSKHIECKIEISNLCNELKRPQMMSSRTLCERMLDGINVINKCCNEVVIATYIFVVICIMLS